MLADRMRMSVVNTGNMEYIGFVFFAATAYIRLVKINPTNPLEFDMSPDLPVINHNIYSSFMDKWGNAYVQVGTNLYKISKSFGIQLLKNNIVALYNAVVYDYLDDCLYLLTGNFTNPIIEKVSLEGITVNSTPFSMWHDSYGHARFLMNILPTKEHLLLFIEAMWDYPDESYSNYFVRPIHKNFGVGGAWVNTAIPSSTYSKPTLISDNKFCIPHPTFRDYRVGTINSSNNLITLSGILLGTSNVSFASNITFDREGSFYLLGADSYPATPSRLIKGSVDTTAQVYNKTVEIARNSVAIHRSVPVNSNFIVFPKQDGTGYHAFNSNIGDYIGQVNFIGGQLLTLRV